MEGSYFLAGNRQPTEWDRTNRVIGKACDRRSCVTFADFSPDDWRTDDLSSVDVGLTISLDEICADCVPGCLANELRRLADEIVQANADMPALDEALAEYAA